MRKAVSGMVILALIAGIVTLCFEMQPVKASGTVYIRADGSIEGTTDILTVDNITYTFLDNINEPIVVEKDNIVVDGAGYTVQGTGAVESTGIDLLHRSNVTIENMEITAFGYGINLWLGSIENSISGNTITAIRAAIWLQESSNNNSVSGNTITNNGWYGIYIWDSTNNTVFGNNITDNNYDGILLRESDYNLVSKNIITDNEQSGIRLSEFSKHNIISGNSIIDNEYSIALHNSSNNKFYRNNFIGNIQQVQIETSGYANFWDDGVGEGNFWSDYEERYPNATEIDGAGIWDTPYVIDEDNQDNYPVIPELPSLIILPLFMTATLLVVIFCMRRHLSAANACPQNL